MRSLPATMSGTTMKCGTRSATFSSTPFSASARSSCWWPEPIEEMSTWRAERNSLSVSALRRPSGWSGRVMHT
jgi:hypothetical protein